MAFFLHLLHLTLKSTVFLKLLEPLSQDLRCGVTFLTTGSSCSQPLQVKVNSPKCGRPSLIRFILPVVVAVVGISGQWLGLHTLGVVMFKPQPPWSDIHP